MPSQAPSTVSSDTIHANMAPPNTEPSNATHPGAGPSGTTSAAADNDEVWLTLGAQLLNGSQVIRMSRRAWTSLGRQGRAALQGKAGEFLQKRVRYIHDISHNRHVYLANPQDLEQEFFCKVSLNPSRKSTIMTPIRRNTQTSQDSYPTFNPGHPGPPPQAFPAGQLPLPPLPSAHVPQNMPQNWSSQPLNSGPPIDGPSAAGYQLAAQQQMIDGIYNILPPQQYPYMDMPFGSFSNGPSTGTENPYLYLSQLNGVGPSTNGSNEIESLNSDFSLPNDTPYIPLNFENQNFDPGSFNGELSINGFTSAQNQNFYNGLDNQISPFIGSTHNGNQNYLSGSFNGELPINANPSAGNLPIAQPQASDGAPNGIHNGVPNGLSNGVPNGVHNETFSGVSNGELHNINMVPAPMDWFPNMGSENFSHGTYLKAPLESGNLNWGFSPPNRGLANLHPNLENYAIEQPHAFNGAPNAMDNGVSNGQPNGAPHVMHDGIHNGAFDAAPNGLPNGVSNGVPNGPPNGVPHVMHNGTQNGVNTVPNGLSNGISNGIPNGPPNGVPHVMHNGTNNGVNTLPNGPPNDIPNGIHNGVFNVMPNELPNGAPNGMPNGAPNGIHIGVSNGVSDEAEAPDDTNIAPLGQSRTAARSNRRQAKLRFRLSNRRRGAASGQLAAPAAPVDTASHAIADAVGSDVQANSTQHTSEQTAAIMFGLQQIGEGMEEYQGVQGQEAN